MAAAPHRREARVVALAVVLAIVLLALGAGAPAAARPLSGPVVHLHSAGGVAPDGRSIGISLVASCPERWTVVEAVVTVSQPSATGTAPFPLTCSGSLRPFHVFVPSSGGTFVLGEARLSASVTIQRGKTQTVQESLQIQAHPTVLVDLPDTATLESGGAVTLAVTVACTVGATPEQSYVNVSQGQTAFGNATYLPVCDGAPHAIAVRVPAAQGVFRTGDARALSFAFVSVGENGFSGLDDAPLQIVR